MCWIFIYILEMYKYSNNPESFCCCWCCDVIPSDFTARGVTLNKQSQCGSVATLLYFFLFCI